MKLLSKRQRTLLLTVKPRARASRLFALVPRVLFFVPGELLHHSSGLLAAITALRNGLGKELSGSSFLRILRHAQGP